MIPLQFDLFEENDELTLLRHELVELKKSCDKQRKAQFAKLSEIAKDYISLREELYETRMAMISRKK